MFSDYFEISLGEFNQEYFESLPDNRHIEAPTMKTEKFYHTVFVDGEQAGIVGFIPAESMRDTGFVQILLAPAFRGKGLIGKIYDRMIELHSLKTLYATIEKSNSASVRAHDKIGFKILPEEKLQELRAKGLLQPDEIRMERDI
jgi:RimJ/RimL family protein N-acetyltransferase